MEWHGTEGNVANEMLPMRCCQCDVAKEMAKATTDRSPYLKGGGGWSWGPLPHNEKHEPSNVMCGVMVMVRNG